MKHVDEINTDWDDPDGWAKQTAPFLNTLHPVTGNLVEHAIRVRGSYSYPVIQQFIRKADAQIRRILEQSEKHDPHAFRAQNYSTEEYAKVTSYVRNILRIFRMYYQTADEYLMMNSLKCVDMSIGNLSEMLDRIESALDDKLSPRCGIKEMEHDVQNLVALMNVIEGQKSASGERPSETLQLANIPEKKDTDVFENPMKVFPPPELESTECIVDIHCSDKQKSKQLIRKLEKVSSIVIAANECEGEVIVVVSPYILETRSELSVAAINEVIGRVKQVLVHNNCKELQAQRDEYQWVRSQWELG